MEHRDRAYTRTTSVIAVAALGTASRPGNGDGGGSAVRSTRTGACFHPLLPYTAWQELGAKLGTYSNATSWWLGDWLAFGQLKYGRRYKDAIAATGLDYQTLRNYTVVCRRFEHPRRRADVSFQHHAEVCAMTDEEQDRWLERAAAGRWSRNELRRRLRAELISSGSRPPHVVRLEIDGPRAERWRTASAASGGSLAAWMIAALDDAARAAVAGQTRRPGSTYRRRDMRLRSRADG
jgi:hypothetical protein